MARGNIWHTVGTQKHLWGEKKRLCPSLPWGWCTHGFLVFHSKKPGGKGKRLPEVYCIVSRLGCFSLFSKVRTWASEKGGREGKAGHRKHPTSGTSIILFPTVFLPTPSSSPQGLHASLTTGLGNNSWWEGTGSETGEGESQSAHSWGWGAEDLPRMFHVFFFPSSKHCLLSY